MLVVLLPLAGLSVLIAFLAFGFEFRRAFLHAAIACGLLVVAFAEGLSVFSAINQLTFACAWAGVAVAALTLAWRRRKTLIPLLRARSYPGWPCVAVVLAALPILAGIVLSAVYAPPNTIDVLVYHMPRVVFWSQAGDLGFFPTKLYQQLSMPPFHEYVMLHVYILTGSDHFVQLVSLAAFVGCILGVSIIARSFGCGVRGQVAAAVFCLTLPNAILQGSSAKNDMTLAFWLVVAVCFASWRWDDFTREQTYGVSAALALAFLTKGTAYLYGPALLGGIFLAQDPIARRSLLRRLPAMIALVLLLNGGYYLRNISDSGRPLGPPSAAARGFFTFANDRFGVETTGSNVLRNATLQLVARPAWSEFAYQRVLAIHDFLGWDPNNPATTWIATEYTASEPGNHEATAANPYHVLLFVLCIGWLTALRRWGRAGWYVLGLVVAALLFCSYLRWQPWHARLHLPLFIATAPVAGLAIEHLRSTVLALAILGGLVWTARIPLLDNELRSLRGPKSVFQLDRALQYSPHEPNYRQPLERLATVLSQSDCRSIGIDVNRDSRGYHLMAGLLGEDPAFRFQHLGVENLTVRYRPNQPVPCAAVCLNCDRSRPSSSTYLPDSAPVEPATFGPHLLYLNEGPN